MATTTRKKKTPDQEAAPPHYCPGSGFHQKKHPDLPAIRQAA